MFVDPTALTTPGPPSIMRPKTPSPAQDHAAQPLPGDRMDLMYSSDSDTENGHDQLTRVTVKPLASLYFHNKQEPLDFDDPWQKFYSSLGPLENSTHDGSLNNNANYAPEAETSRAPEGVLGTDSPHTSRPEDSHSRIRTSEQHSDDININRRISCNMPETQAPHSNENKPEDHWEDLTDYESYAQHTQNLAWGKYVQQHNLSLDDLQSLALQHDGDGKSERAAVCRLRQLGYGDNPNSDAANRLPRLNISFEHIQWRLPRPNISFERSNPLLDI
jgi:hypothetical protein